MIVTKLIGGLGNQMFQYAAGRRVAYINKAELKLDITGYENQGGMTKREYLLSCFNICENFASEKEIKKIKKVGENKLSRYFLKFISIYTPYNSGLYIVEKHFCFDPKILKLRDNSYLEGYWASEKYFEDIREIVRKEFTFKDNPDTVNQKLISRIKNCNSVSIHIRRGDYVFNEKTNKHHGTCDLEYYLRAVDLIITNTKNPSFFVFSDDIKWAKQNLHLKFPHVFVDHNTNKKDYEDMRPMSLCKHNIIANSSFSWWGAWLNQNPNKIVVAPKRWFRDKSIDTRDLVPRSWIKI